MLLSRAGYSEIVVNCCCDVNQLIYYSQQASATTGRLKKGLILCLFGFGLLTTTVSADVVKPALIEVSVYRTGHATIEIRASIEALLTGINSQYKTTQESPQAAAYDALRKLPSDELQASFKGFHQQFLDQVWLKFNGRLAGLVIDSVSVPEPGYTKIPRISTIMLRAAVPPRASTVQWYYPAAFGNQAVRVREVDRQQEQWHWSQWEWQRKDKPTQVFSLETVYAKRPLWKTISSYTVLGFYHIVPKGMDHVLFILGLFLLSTQMRPLLLQVTMFTVAHTLTLGLSMTGAIELPPRIVEPLIALSIAYVGFENIWARTLHTSRLYLVFGFGLLHGMGFASVLADFGMPSNRFLTALISFNIGVELGQLAVILAAFLLIGLWFGRHPNYHHTVVVPASLIIGCCGLVWTVERVLA